MEMKRFVCIQESFYRNRHWSVGDMFTTDLPIRCNNFRVLADDEHPRGQIVFIEKTSEEIEQERINLATEHPLPGSTPRKPAWRGSESSRTRTDYGPLP